MPQKSLSRPPKIRPRKYFENEIFRTFEECMSYSKAFKLKSPNGKVLCWPFLSYLEIFTKILPYFISLERTVGGSNYNSVLPCCLSAFSSSKFSFLVATAALKKSLHAWILSLFWCLASFNTRCLPLLLQNFATIVLSLPASFVPTGWDHSIWI